MLTAMSSFQFRKK